MSAVSLKELLRKSKNRVNFKGVLEDMIKAVQPAAKWKLLVVDGNSAKLLNTICKSHEILQENVTVIEDMSTKRQPFVNYEAIYFVTPSTKTIDRIILDFKDPIYLAAHIFFTASLDDNLFAKIKQSGITKYIKTLKEMNVDFIALEQQVFTMDMPLALFPLYSPSGLSNQQQTLEKISKKIMSVLITLGDSPFIRYYDPNKTSSNINYKLAQILQNDLDELAKNDDSFPTKNEYKRPVLIITDRSFDMIAPFLHEFTYQAMMNDLIVKPPEVENGIRNVTYFFPSPTYSVLDETDSIWMLIRHWHFAEAVDYILTNFQKFLTENKAAAAALGNQGNETGIDALKSMKETLSSLPQFQSLKQKYSIHISICQDAKMYFEKRNLDLVASVQQDLATGETSDGKAIKNSMMDLIPVLDNKKTSPMDKLRSLIVYIIAMNGVQDMERRRLLETAKITSDDSQAISNLSLFDVILSSSQDKKSNKDKKYTYWGSVKQERKKKKSKADNTYDLSRYVPLIKRVMEDQVSNSIPTDNFPWVREPKPEELGIANNTLKMFRFTSNGLVPPDPNYPHSLRTTRASWAGKGRVKGKNEDSEKDKLDLRVNGSRIIVFCLGGITYSEMRTVYEASRENQREIYLGSTFVYNPTQFVDVLKEMHKQELPPLPTSPMTADLPKEEKKSGIFGKRK